MHDDPNHYRFRAEELRTIADTMRDPACADTLRRLAIQHEARAEKLEADKNSKQIMRTSGQE